MRYFFVYISLLLPLFSFGQTQKTAIVSSASEWVRLTVTVTDTVAVVTKRKSIAKPTKPKPAVASEATSKTVVADATPPKAPETSPVTAASVRPKPAPVKPVTRAFLETFADNTNGWLIGKRNGFDLEIAKDSYYIRRQDDKNTRPGRSYIKLPNDLNLNKIDTFTISVEMVIPPNVEPDGGLLIGVKDTSNYCQFRIIGTSKVALYTCVNGMAKANYMAGKPTAAKVPISPTRNTLTIRRTGAQLHFYINGKEVEDSPHPYQPFKGNGIGFISFAEAVKFQYLTVQPGR